MKHLRMAACLFVLASSLAIRGNAQPALAATSVGTNHIKITFTSAFVPAAWRVCWKEGQANPRPACWRPADNTIVRNESPTAQSGSYTITGLHKNRWYTVVVREQKQGNVWMDKLGSLHVKTPKK